MLPALYAPEACAADLVPWRTPTGPRLTVVAKIGFSLPAGEAAQLLPLAAEIIERDRHHERSPARSLEAASDLAPSLPCAEIIVAGHAYATQGRHTPSLTAQIQVARGTEIVLRKRAQIIGDRARPDVPPTPFQRMPLIWERAQRTAENPVGLAVAPNIVDPADPTRAAGFGPIASTWLSRRALLANVPPGLVDAEPISLPSHFDDRYFLAAPIDQRLPALNGAEWIALDGMHPLLPRLQFRLPGCTLLAGLVGPNGLPEKVSPLTADRLVLDTDRQIGTLTYRCTLPVDWTSLGKHRIDIGLARPGESMKFPPPRDPRFLRAHKRSVQSSAVAITAVPETPAGAAALPFSASSRTEGPRSLGASSIDALRALTPSGVRRIADELSDVTVDDSSTPAPIAPSVGDPFETSKTVVLPPAAAQAIGQQTALPTASLDLGKIWSAPVPFADVLKAGQGREASTEGLPFSPLEEETTGFDGPSEGANTRRTPDSVPTVSDTGFSVVTFAWQIRPPQESLVVVVKGSFDIVRGERAKPRDQSDGPWGRRLRR